MILCRSILAAALLSAATAFAQSGAGSTAGAGAGSPAQGQAQQQQTPPAPLTPADKPNLSYAIGYQIGNDFQERKLDIDELRRVYNA